MKLSDLSKKKRLGLFVLSGALILAFMAFLILKDIGLSKRETVGDNALTTTDIEIPDAQPDPLEASKLRAYGSPTQAERLWDDAGDFYDVSDSSDSGKETGSPSQESASQSGSVVHPHQAASSPAVVNPAADILDSPSRSASSSAPRPGDPGYKEYRMNQFYDGSSRASAPAASSTPATSSASSAPEPVQEPVKEQRMNVPVDTLRRSATMDLMADAADDDGFSSLDPSPSGRGGDSRPFECMFVREEKIRNGSRVSVRLLEDLAVGGTLIPRNTHLQAICRINERLEMSITSIRVGSRIYSINYEAYDNDGYKGIYCPDVNQESRRQATSSGLSLFNSMIGSRVGRIASEAVRTGVAVAQNKSGEVTVSVPMGYRFFLVQSEQ